MNVIKGIGLGIGFILGLLIAIGVVVSIFFIIISIMKLVMRRKFTVELFKHYQNELLENERFEELSEVNMIIKRLEKKEKPTEILKNYSIKIESYFYWIPTYDGGERLTYKFDKYIIKNKINTEPK
jgi:hypothetical protein